METEQQLLEAIRRGDRHAQHRLYERYAGYAMAVGRRYLPDHDEVRDVLQDSFVKILTSVGQFNYRGEGSLKAWVGRIVSNRAIDYVKERSRMAFLQDIPEKTSDENALVERIPPEVLTTMIGRLPAGSRIIVNLHVFEELSHWEIAQRLGIKADSSASQYARAKERLAQMIKEYLNGRKHER